MVGPMAQMAPDQAVARFLPDALQGIAALGTGDIGSVFRALVANTPGTSNEAVTRAFAGAGGKLGVNRSEEHTSELQSLMRTSYAVFCLKKKKKRTTNEQT